MNARSRNNFFSYRTIAALVVVMLALVTLPATPVYAAACTSNASGNWNVAGTWTGCGGIIPGAADTVTIQSGHTVTVTANAAASSITFSETSTSTGIITVNSGVTLTVTNDITLRNDDNTDISASLGGLGTISAASVTVGGTQTNITSNSTTILTSSIATLSISGTLNVNGEDTGNSHNNATFNLGSGSVSVGGSVILDADDDGGSNSSATLTMATGSQNGTLTLSAATPVSTLGTGTKTFTPNGTTATVVYSGAAQTVQAVAYRNLMLSGSGDKSMASGTSVNGTLSIAPTGSAKASIAAGQNLSVNSLTLGGLGRISGTWGSTTSSPAATNQNNTYFAATTGRVTVSTDSRATPGITTLPTASGITYGQALSASTLTGGSASVTGTFAFTTPATQPSAGTFSAPVTFTPADLTSYKTVADNVNVAVAKVALSVTANADNKVYNGVAYSGGNGVAYSGFVNGDTSSSLGGTLTFSGTSQGAVSVGGYVITPGGLTSSNYNITFNNGTLTITARPVTVTADSGQTKVFGAADPTFTFGVSPVLVSGDSFTGALSRVAGEDVGTYAITQGTLSAGSNYTITFVSANFSITAKPITVTPNNGQSKVYGAADPALTFTSTPLETGDTFSGALGRTAGSNVGTYAFTLDTLSAGSNYTLSLDPGHTFAITAKPVTVTADSGQDKVFGAADPTFTFGVSPALVSGDSFSGALDRSGGEDVGTYAITLGTLSAGSNYSITFVSANFIITAKPITVTPNNGQSKVYGAVDPAFTFTSTPLEGGDTFSGALDRAAGSNVGTYAFSLGTLSAGSNYTLSLDPGHTFAITAKPITVTADSGQDKVFGAADPVFTYISSDLGASFTGALSRVAGEDVGTYDITQGTLSAGSNYTITFVSADFSITAKLITVTPNNGQSKVYGAPDPTFTFTSTPLETGDTFNGAIGRLAGEDVGTYAFTLGTLSAGSNYTLSLDPGHTFAITAKPITVTADSGQTKVFGEADPTFTFGLSPALVSGDSFTGTLSRAAGEDIGTYAITQGTLSAGSNYTITFVSADFSITAKPITVTADSGQSKVFGAADPVFTYVASDPGASFTGALSRAAGEDVGTYAITQGTLSAGSNYTITFVSADFSITAKPITVTADSGQSKVFGTADPVFTYVSSDLGASFTSALSRAAGEDVGTYAITQGTLSAGSNYTITFVSADFSITAGPITVTADDKSRFVGDPDPTFTFSASGFVGLDTFITEPTCTVSGPHNLEGTYPIVCSGAVVGSNYTLNPYGDGTLTVGPVTTEANIDVRIHGALQASYVLSRGQSTRKSYAGLNNGPVEVTNAGILPITAAERVIYKANNVNTSFSEMMGLPDAQLDTTYWLPWYNNVDLDTQLRFGNVSGSTATVHVSINGVEMTGSPFTLAPGESTRKSFVGVNNGPVKIESDQLIVAAERVIYKVNNVNTSFTEMMALPNSELDTTYWLPWYNNADLDTQLRFANVSAFTATVHVSINGVEMTGSPFTLAPGASTRKSFVGVNNGPVKIESDQLIVAAERVIYKANNINTSFSEMMALPDAQLDMVYWLPWYNNADLDTQLRFANVTTSTATVHVFIGGQEMPGSPFTLLPGESTRKSFANINSGPVQIVSDVSIVAAERLIYKVNNIATSFSEMMALPNGQLDTIYWLPWYNNVDLDTQLRFGVP